MSTMVIELYEALLEAGASKEKATKAAEVASSFIREDDNILTTLATKDEMHVVQAELKMVKWIVSGVGFGMILLVIENFMR